MHTDCPVMPETTFCYSMLVTSCSDVLGHWVSFFKNNCHCIALSKIVILHWCFVSRYWLHQSNQHLVSIHLFLVLGSLFLSLYSYFIPLCCQEIIHMLQLWARGLEITPFLHFIFFLFACFSTLLNGPKSIKKYEHDFPSHILIYCIYERCEISFFSRRVQCCYKTLEPYMVVEILGAVTPQAAVGVWKYLVKVELVSFVLIGCSWL